MLNDLRLAHARRGHSMLRGLFEKNGDLRAPGPFYNRYIGFNDNRESLSLKNHPFKGLSSDHPATRGKASKLSSHVAGFFSGFLERSVGFGVDFSY